MRPGSRSVGLRTGGIAAIENPNTTANRYTVALFAHPAILFRDAILAPGTRPLKGSYRKPLAGHFHHPVRRRPSTPADIGNGAGVCVCVLPVL